MREETGNVVFEEEQRFRQPWLWMLFIAEAALFGGLIVKHPHPPAVIALVILVVGGSFLMFLFWTMRTEVRSDSVYIRFWPMKRRIPLEDIKSVEARTYSPIREYGGWGFRYGRSGKAYNVSGNRGVQLELKSGEHILIGSQKADDLAAAIQGEMRRIS